MDKQTVLIGSAVLLLILVGVGASLKKGPSSETAAPAANQIASSTEAAATASSTPTSTAQKAPAPALSYTQAVNVYAGRRIQFDANCVMSPNGLVVRNGTNVMLDNRSPSARSIYLDRKEFRISGYGYRIVLFSYRTIPHTVAIDCGTGRGTGTALVQ